MSRLIVVAGPAGSGKSEFSAKLAKKLSLNWIDFDDDIDELISKNAETISKSGMEKFLAANREARYQNLIRRAKESIAQGRSLIISAPFSREVQSEELWQEKFREIVEQGVTPKLIWINTPADVRRTRITMRNAKRDSEKANLQLDEIELPKIGHIAVAGSVPFEDLPQLDLGS